MRLTRLLRCASNLPESNHNMPKGYIKKQLDFVESRRPKLPWFVQKTFRYKNNAYYDMWRPWEKQFQDLNQPQVKVRKIFVEPIKDFPMFLGDRVEILKGKDKGKQGLVNYIVKERNWVCVEGLNLSRRRSNQSETSVGQIVCSEEPLLVNHEVKLVDPTDLFATDIEWKYDVDGKRVRLSKRTGRIIPIPRRAQMTVDYSTKAQYKERPKDTLPEAATRITFKPAAKTFEMDICEKFGIEDKRIPYPMYWY